MWIELLLLVLLVVLYAYYEVTKQFNFFKELGLPYSTPSFPFGSLGYWKMFTGKITVVDVDEADLEQEHLKHEKVVGAFAMGQPVFIINDEELAKRVLIKDFDHFMDRRVMKTSDKVMSGFLTQLTGASWKRMRTLMSGVFTSGKLKLMFKYIWNVGLNLEKYVSKVAEEGLEVDMKEVGGKMTLDSIATAGFGIETDSFDDPDNVFRVQALTMVGAPGYTPRFQWAKIFLMFIFPKLCAFLKITFLNKGAVKFFSTILQKAYKQRLATGERRNDIIDLIADELKSSKDKKPEQNVVPEYESNFEKDAALDMSDIKDISDIGLDEETLLLANALVFFFAGFETTSTGFSMCCHKLAIHPDIQQKVFEEIESVIGCQSEASFSQLQDLKYMDKFISEAFRCNEIVPAHERVCTKNYPIPGTDAVIPKDRIVRVYTKSISSSSDNFYNPNEFDPENFAPENNPNKFALMIFGQGPRNCIGMRYALLTLKASLVSILRGHKIVRCSRTNDKLVVDTKNMNTFTGGVYVKFEKRG